MCRLNSKLSHRMVNIEWQMNAKMRIFSGPFVAVVLEHGALCLRALTRLNHSLNCKCRWIPLYSFATSTHPRSKIALPSASTRQQQIRDHFWKSSHRPRSPGAKKAGVDTLESAPTLLYTPATCLYAFTRPITWSKSTLDSLWTKLSLLWKMYPIMLFRKMARSPSKRYLLGMRSFKNTWLVLKLWVFWQRSHSDAKTQLWTIILGCRRDQHPRYSPNLYRQFRNSRRSECHIRNVNGLFACREPIHRRRNTFPV